MPGRESIAPPFCSTLPLVSWPPIIFCKDNTNMEFRCVSKLCKNGKFVASVKRPKTKCVLASGGFAPLAQGVLPLDPAEGSAPRRPL